jgi:Lrp/AsnC family leucine-responsive transcriptional regulator
MRQDIGASHYDAVVDTQGLVKSALVASWANGPRHGMDRASAREPLATSFYQAKHAVPRELHAVERNRLLAAAALGYPLRTVARIKLERPREKAMQDFERRMRALPRVAQCLTVAGDIDYIVLVRSRDVAHYQDFARHVLATAPGIRAYTSEIVLDIPKWTTEVPVDD